MNSTNTGGPAFPIVGTLEDIQEVGMTLRDYFASHMPDEPTGDDYATIVKEALVGRKKPMPEDGWVAVIQFEADFRAAWRYMRADAMLKAREA